MKKAKNAPATTPRVKNEKDKEKEKSLKLTQTQTQTQSQTFPAQANSAQMTHESENTSASNVLDCGVDDNDFEIEQRDRDFSCDRLSVVVSAPDQTTDASTEKVDSISQVSSVACAVS